MGLKTVATYCLGRTTATATAGSITTISVSLNITQGSVLDFSATTDESERTTFSERRIGAIVNAANEQCLYGGGVDGAINDAGGPTLWEDRMALPVIEGTSGVRCQTGSAVVTGPNRYGKLNVPYVVHAVGPAYSRFDGDGDAFSLPDALLRSAYQQSLERCHDMGITDVAFSLLSAGVFRGQRSLHDVLTIGVTAIQDWVRAKEEQNMEAAAAIDGQGREDRSGSPHRLKSVTLCAFSRREIGALTTICRNMFEETNGADDQQEGEKRETENSVKETAIDVEDNEKQDAATREAAKKPEAALEE